TRRATAPARRARTGTALSAVLHRRRRARGRHEPPGAASTPVLRRSGHRRDCRDPSPERRVNADRPTVLRWCPPSVGHRGSPARQRAGTSPHVTRREWCKMRTMAERVDTGLLDTAHEVGTVAADHVDESDAARCLAPPVVEAIEANGLNALLAPTAMGGQAADPRAIVEVVEAISTHEASAGWCAAISTGSNYLAGIIPETAARSVFTDLSRGGAGPFAPGAMALPENAKVRVAGRWPYSSNCTNAAVSASGVILTEDGRPKVSEHGVELGLAFLTRDQFAIEETWNTDGLRATGSHDIVADAVLEPELISSLWVDKWPDDAIFRLRTFDVLGPCLAAVPLGIGRAALDVVGARAVREAAGPPKMGPKP